MYPIESRPFSTLNMLNFNDSNCGNNMRDYCCDRICYELRIGIPELLSV